MQIQIKITGTTWHISTPGTIIADSCVVAHITSAREDDSATMCHISGVLSTIQVYHFIIFPTVHCIVHKKTVTNPHVKVTPKYNTALHYNTDNCMYKMVYTCTHNSLKHMGSSPDHTPSGGTAVHTRVSFPTKVKPISHSYVALSPGLMPVIMTFPLVTLSGGHSTTISESENKFQLLTLWAVV